MRPEDRIVITGIGLTAPNGNSMAEFRKNLLAGVSGVRPFETRYMGDVIAGVCDFDELKYQKKKSLRRGTRAGSIAIYCAQEAVADSGLAFDTVNKSRVGVYLGTTEHGNVETENEVYAISKYNYDIKYWSHHHNPRTVANNPAGEVTLNMGITGPHYAIGAACAAGNLGIIQGAQMLRLNEVDLAIAGGVSESIHTFGIFASFKSEGALAEHKDPIKASRPFDKNRNGIVCSEGGGIYTLERLPEAEARGARIYGEIIGHASNSDAYDYILPEPGRQAECMQLALGRAGLKPEDIDILNTHATATQVGDIQECKAVREVFGMEGRTRINNTKSYIGHTMGAAGVIELTGNLPAFEDGYAHPTINLDEIDPECRLNHLVANTPERLDKVNIIMNNSFGMFGINSVLIVRKYQK
ncbi:MAG: beta-ketoacyl-[acyl-carrier-protein] synthase family protein [Nitrospinae bacterium]|nr:beta-ketoacyl-[acyl-carrier-protein] synthase family protein [Nitrospinota bacterium]